MSIAAITRYCPKLSLFGLYDCKNIQSEGILFITAHCKQLTKLYIPNSDFIISSIWDSINKYCPNLEMLDESSGTLGVGRSSKFTIGALTLPIAQHINDNITHKKNLYRTKILESNIFCRHIRDEALSIYLEHNPELRLKEIDFRKYGFITQKGIISLIPVCLQLETVKFNHTVEDRTIITFTEKCTQLKELYVQEILFNSIEMLEKIIINCKYLEILGAIESEMKFYSNKIQPSNIKDNINALIIKGYLKKIKIENCALLYTILNDDALSAYTHFNPELKEIDLRKFKNISEAGIIRMLPFCKRLKRLSIENISIDIINSIGENCPDLAVLLFSKSTTDINRTLTLLADKCKNLEELTIPSYDKTSLDESSLLILLANCVQLKKITNYCAISLTNKTFEKLASCGERLTIEFHPLSLG